MMVMTAKVDIKKIIVALAALAGVIIALVLLLGGGKDSAPTAAPSVAGNNELQKSAGYDLSQYAGKTVMRYVYKVNNFPGATEPVYATLLVYKNQVIGGDITNTAASGTMQALTKATLPPAQVPETTAPAQE